jgi:hypothetical protein
VLAAHDFTPQDRTRFLAHGAITLGTVGSFGVHLSYPSVTCACPYGDRFGGFRARIAVSADASAAPDRIRRHEHIAAPVDVASAGGGHDRTWRW